MVIPLPLDELVTLLMQGVEQQIEGQQVALQQAEIAVQEKPPFFRLAGGIGFRIVDLEKGVQDYVATLNNIEGLDVEDLPEGNIPLPYLTLQVEIPHERLPLFFQRNRLQPQFSFDWVSSLLLGTLAGKEHVSLEYNDVEMAEATAKWTDYLGSYYSFAGGIDYPVKTLQPTFFGYEGTTFAFFVGGEVGVSYVKNKFAMDTTLDEDSPILELATPEFLASEYNIYTKMSSSIFIRGIGYRTCMASGLQTRVRSWTATATFGYCSETLQMVISEETILGDHEKRTEEITRIPVNASGATGSVTVGHQW